MKKKLIEVALPLEAINKASAYEKMPGIGPHPRGLHLWWARRPLAAARAVIFAQMVDDPSSLPDLFPTEPKQQKERERLFRIIEELVQWENTTNETVLEKARAEIWQSWRRACAEHADHPRAKELFDRYKLPAFHDPFAGGGALPLEAQRLGLEAYASDLNPVAVLINKAMIEIPPRFAGRPPVNPEARREKVLIAREWKGAQGLAEDVRYYGQWMRDEAEKRIGHLYPKIEITAEMAKDRPDLEPYVGQKLTVIAWLWARTVKSPNPAFAKVDVPLASTFMLSTKAGKEAYVEPVIEDGLPAPSPGRYYVYAIECDDGSHYIGQTEDLPKRWREHQEGRAADWTATHKPVRLAHFEELDSREAAVQREKDLKTGFGRKWLKEQIASGRARQAGGYRFSVKVGKPKDAERAKRGTKLSRGANFECVMSGTPIAPDYIYAEANAGRMGARLMAIVAEGERGRVYLAPTPEHEAAARKARPEWKPDVAMPDNPRWFSPPLYGLKTYGDLFTPRQLVALTTFSDLVGEAMEQVRRDALEASSEWRGERNESASPLSPHSSDLTPLRDGGTGAAAYAEAVGVYLSFTVDRCADFSNSCTRWVPGNQKVMNLFGKQAIAMTWDFPEAAILHETVGGFGPACDFIASCIAKVPQEGLGSAAQQDATTSTGAVNKVVSTDPPYYDNIGYADLSDFFYVWLRRSLRGVFPELFATLAVPRAEELVATPYRHGSKEMAESFFLEGMTQAMHRLVEQAHPAFPVTIYYAFKQSESETDAGTASTGWETFLDAVIRAGFGISGTWPMRSEQEYRMIGMGTNALASSIVLVCRKRAADAPTATRREFVAALKAELPTALRRLQEGNIAPVDLAQAAIGPGMAVYTRYSKVLDAEGKPVPVREALALINQVLDETLAEQEGDFDADTRFALAWFEQHGFTEGEFGLAETLSKAKNTSLDGLEKAGILKKGRGKVRLLKPSELPADWPACRADRGAGRDPATDDRLTHWETVHHLIRVLEAGGESAAAELVAKLGSKAETARELAYRLYTVCERKKRAAEALAYNALVQSFPEITRLAREGGKPKTEQAVLFGETEE